MHQIVSTTFRPPGGPRPPAQTRPGLEVISREDARARGLPRYFTGRACLNGHVAERRVSDCGCVECRREHLAKWRATPEYKVKKREYKEREKERLARWRATPEGRAKRREYRAKGREGCATPGGRAAKLISKARNRAKAKGLPFDLDVKWVAERIEKGCAMTGEPFNLTDKPPKGSHVHRKAPSLDRIDNTRGYTKDNVWVICASVNVAKNSMSIDVFWSMCAKVCKTLPALRAAGII